MKSFAQLSALCLLQANIIVAAELSLVDKPTVQFSYSGTEKLAANRLVFIRELRDDGWRSRVTDSQGRVTDDYYRGHARERGESAGRSYFMLPHQPERWSLRRATNKAMPSALPVAEKPDSYQRTDVIEKLGRRVRSRWDKFEGRHGLIAEPVPVPGVIRMQARTRSGEPLRDHPVELFARDLGHGFSSRETVVWAGRTDKEGWLEIRQFPGISNWIVRYPGVGHTQTGPIVVDPGSQTTLRLNRPVPFATIAGRVDKELLGSLTEDARIFVATDHAWRYREAEIDTDGKFHLSEVPAGCSYRLKVKGAAIKRLIVENLLPGELRDGFVLEPTGKQETQLASENQGVVPQQSTVHNWKPTLRGRVVDQSGQGVADATVYATMKYHGGIRMYQETKEAVTNDRGEYEIPEAEFKFGSIALIAHVPGSPPAIGAGGYWGPTTDSSVLVGVGGVRIGSEPNGLRPEVLEQPDLVLPSASQGGELRVVALKQGTPQEGVLVRLELMDFHSSFSPGWAAGRTPEALNKVLTPTEKTNADGEALFSDLTPGLYRVTASMAKPKKAQESPYNNRWKGYASSIATHVPVLSGSSRKLSLFVAETDETCVPLKIKHTDGTWLAGISIATSRLRPVSGGGGNSGSKLDSNGVGKICPDYQGFWNLRVRYLTPGLGSGVKTPIRHEPSYEGNLQVAISRLAPRLEPVVFRPRLLEPARIAAVIHDENGEPVRGAVALDVGRHGSFQQHETRFAMTDAAGHVRFERVQSGTHKLQAMLPGWKAALPTLDASDAELQQEFDVPAIVTEVGSGDESTVVLRRQRVAYIRGKVTPTSSADEPLYLSLVDNWTRRPLDSRCLISSETGEFIIGPLLPGKHRVETRGPRRNPQMWPVVHEFDVVKPGVHREDIPYRPRPILEAERASDSVSGTVYKADGQTPVYGARISTCTPGQVVARAGTWSDATGKFSIRQTSVRSAYAAGQTDSEGRLSRPAVVAWLPGNYGARVVPLPALPGAGNSGAENNNELKIVLPNPATVRGVVTINGKSTLGRPASLRVLAEFHGREKLSPVLSVQTTANADGSYELRGLTPGDYDLQACVEEVWLSLPQQFSVPEGKESSQIIDLDVPALGAAAQFQFVDGNGKALADQSVRLLAPELSGPLGKSLRTATVRTDHAGVLRLEGLAAGEHELTVESASSNSKVRIPPLGKPMLSALRVVVD